LLFTHLFAMNRLAAGMRLFRDQKSPEAPAEAGLRGGQAAARIASIQTA
jgi:hypothetical protein